MVIDQGLLVADRMFDPFVAWITIVLHGNSNRIVCHPYPALFVYIDIIDTVSVHAIVAVVVCYNKWLGLISLNVHFIDTSAIGGDQ